MKKLLALMMALALLLTTAMAEDLVFTGAVEQEEMTDEELIALIHPEYPESDLLSHKLPEDKKTVTVLPITAWARPKRISRSSLAVNSLRSSAA